MISTIKRFAAPLGLGALAGAVCCALPVVGLLLGAGVASSVAFFVEPVAAVLLVLAMLSAGLIVFFRWRRARAASDTCASDGSCGCGPQQDVVSDGVAMASEEEKADVQSAISAGCTMQPEAIAGRKRAFVGLLNSALLHREAFADRLVWTFRWSESVEAQARALAAAESQCCSFFRFDVVRQGDTLRWTSRTTPGRESGLLLLDRLAREVE